MLLPYVRYIYEGEPVVKYIRWISGLFRLVHFCELVIYEQQIDQYEPYQPQSISNPLFVAVHSLSKTH